MNTTNNQNLAYNVRSSLTLSSDHHHRPFSARNVLTLGDLNHFLVTS